VWEEGVEGEGVRVKSEGMKNRDVTGQWRCKKNRARGLLVGVKPLDAS
jgi:hypothetical protein